MSEHIPGTEENDPEIDVDIKPNASDDLKMPEKVAQRMDMLHYNNVHRGHSWRNYDRFTSFIIRHPHTLDTMPHKLWILKRAKIWQDNIHTNKTH